MKKKRWGLNQKGFTFTELISVLIIIMGAMGSLTVKKIDLLGSTAIADALRAATRELNIRASLTWTNINLLSAGWANDVDVFTAMDTDLGSGYVWTADPNSSIGTLRFRFQSIALNITSFTTSSTGIWK